MISLSLLRLDHNWCRTVPIVYFDQLIAILAPLHAHSVALFRLTTLINYPDWLLRSTTLIDYSIDYSDRLLWSTTQLTTPINYCDRLLWSTTRLTTPIDYSNQLLWSTTLINYSDQLLWSTTLINYSNQLLAILAPPQCSLRGPVPIDYSYQLPLLTTPIDYSDPLLDRLLWSTTRLTTPIDYSDQLLWSTTSNSRSSPMLAPWPCSDWLLLSTTLIHYSARLLWLTTQSTTLIDYSDKLLAILAPPQCSLRGRLLIAYSYQLLWSTPVWGKN
jgi:hypothetical protein